MEKNWKTKAILLFYQVSSSHRELAFTQVLCHWSSSWLYFRIRPLSASAQTSDRFGGFSCLFAALAAVLNQGPLNFLWGWAICLLLGILFTLLELLSRSPFHPVPWVTATGTQLQRACWYLWSYMWFVALKVSSRGIYISVDSVRLQRVQKDIAGQCMTAKHRREQILAEVDRTNVRWERTTQTTHKGGKGGTLGSNAKR